MHVHSKGIRLENEGSIKGITCKGIPDCFRTTVDDFQRVSKQTKLICSAQMAKVLEQFSKVFTVFIPTEKKAG